MEKDKLERKSFVSKHPNTILKFYILASISEQTDKKKQLFLNIISFLVNALNTVVNINCIDIKSYHYMSSHWCTLVYTDVIQTYTFLIKEDKHFVCVCLFYLWSILYKSFYLCIKWIKEGAIFFPSTFSPNKSHLQKNE